LSVCDSLNIREQVHAKGYCHHRESARPIAGDM
jgi:hypothetical protein